MTAKHGIMKPNPVLFDLENRKRKPALAHDLGAGKTFTKYCGLAWHRGSVRASHPSAAGSNPGSAKIFLITA